MATNKRMLSSRRKARCPRLTVTFGGWFGSSSALLSSWLLVAWRGEGPNAVSIGLWERRNRPSMDISKSLTWQQSNKVITPFRCYIWPTLRYVSFIIIMVRLTCNLLFRCVPTDTWDTIRCSHAVHFMARLRCTPLCDGHAGVPAANAWYAEQSRHCHGWYMDRPPPRSAHHRSLLCWHRPYRY